MIDGSASEKNARYIGMGLVHQRKFGIFLIPVVRLTIYLLPISLSNVVTMTDSQTTSITVLSFEIYKTLLYFIMSILCFRSKRYGVRAHVLPLS